MYFASHQILNDSAGVRIKLSQSVPSKKLLFLFVLVYVMCYFCSNRSYEDVLQYYKKSERSELKKYKNAPYSGRDGELTVENVPFK